MTPEDLFRHRMRALRRARGMNQSELGAAIGLSLAVVSKIELGERHIRLNDAAAIAAALGSTIAEMTDPGSRVEVLADVCFA